MISIMTHRTLLPSRAWHGWARFVSHCLVALAALVCFVQVARAEEPSFRQPSSEDLQRAETRFLEGKKLFEQKKQDEALAAFEEAHRLSPFNAAYVGNLGLTEL